MRSARLLAALLSAVLAAAAGAAAYADDKPLWEFGLGAGVLAFNDYRGSFLKSDRDGLRGLFLNQKRVELSLSVNATTPVRNDSVRHGMPDLRPALELGPELDVHLWRSAGEHLKLDLRLPTRAAFTVEAEPHMIGLFTS